jgi:hypothetical protein
MTTPEPATPHAPAHRSTATGPGRVLVLVYGVFAVAATARAGYQIAAKFDEAPLAYLLSALAGVVYVVATVALSVLDAGDFPDETVWSAFGQGYGYVPLVLPFLGIAWLWRSGPGSRSGAAAGQ